METAMKQLVLNKGGEKYIFRYADGAEGSLLDALVDKAGDNSSEFDWFDAAVISFKLTQSLIGQADDLLHKDMPNPLQSFQQDFE